MQSELSSLNDVDLELEWLIERQIGVDPLPFDGMDSKLTFFLSLVIFLESGTQICDLFEQGKCNRGSSCPFRHDDSSER